MCCVKECLVDQIVLLVKPTKHHSSSVGDKGCDTTIHIFQIKQYSFTHLFASLFSLFSLFCHFFRCYSWCNSCGCEWWNSAL